MKILDLVFKRNVELKNYLSFFNQKEDLFNIYNKFLNKKFRSTIIAIIYFSKNSCFLQNGSIER